MFLNRMFLNRIANSRTADPVLVAVVMAATLMLLLVACTASVPTTPEPAPAEPTAAAPIPVATPAGDQTTLIVQFDATHATVRKIDFTEPISGLALLEQSGLDVVKADFDWGTAICSIEGVGCPAEDCFCSEDTFWSYHYWENGSWVGYPVGPAQSLISTTNTVEGWRWGGGDASLVQPERVEAAHDALTWLRAQQVITDGSYGSSAGATIETLFALSANHEDATAWRPAPDAPSILDFMLEHGAEYSQEGVSEAGKLAVALAAADACWPADALAPSAYYSPTVGALHTDAGRLAWGILGTLALDEPAPADSVEYLLNLALPEGGWEWTPEWGRDTNTTALAIQALVAAGTPLTHTAIVSAQQFLQEAQTPEGGFSYDPAGTWGDVADANSTAYVLQALAALESGTEDSTLDNALDNTVQEMSDGAVDFLLGLQGDDGGIGWQIEQPAANLAATQQAIPALLGQPYPIRRAALPICEAP